MCTYTVALLLFAMTIYTAFHSLLFHLPPASFPNFQSPVSGSSLGLIYVLLDPSHSGSLDPQTTPSILLVHQSVTSDAPKRGRGRPRKTQNAEEAHLRKLQTDRERYYKLKMQASVQSDDNEPSIPLIQTIPFSMAPKRTPSPPSSYINTFPQFASPKKTPPQAPSLKERLIERHPSPSNQLFDDWNNTMYNDDGDDDDDDDDDDYSGHTDEGSGGGILKRDIQMMKIAKESI